MRPRANKGPPKAPSAPSATQAGPTIKALLGEHPQPPHPLATFLSAIDGVTTSGVPHRALSELQGQRPACTTILRELVVKHHAAPEMLERSRKAIERLGLARQQALLRRFPTNDKTRKGNLAEVVLAEYVTAATSTALPVYRLRYNPNVEQSMKGDDILAFDLDAEPVRIIVGESKFRTTSSGAAVKEIAEALVRAHRAGVPASLQFVADRLYDLGNANLGDRVLMCAELYVQGKLQLDYVGLLLSDTDAAKRVTKDAPKCLHRLAMLSFGVRDPESLVEACFDKLE